MYVNRLMSQKELEEKYHEGRSTIALAMIRAGVQPAAISENGYNVKLYIEEDAVMALTILYAQRRDNHRQKAEEWARQIGRIERIFQEGKP